MDNALPVPTPLPEPYGRSALLDGLMSEAKQQRTRFGFEGVSGVGKSAVMAAFSERLKVEMGSEVATLDLAELTTEEQLIASLYRQLRNLAQDPEYLVKKVQSRITENIVPAVRKVLGAVVMDIGRHLAEKAESTIEVVGELISGEEETSSLEAQMTALGSDNARYLLRTFLEAVAEAGNRVIIRIDNFDSAESALAEFVSRVLIGTLPSSFMLLAAANTEAVDTQLWDRACSQIRARGGHVCKVPPLAREGILEWFVGLVGRYPTEAELDRLEVDTGGRALDLKFIIEAIAEGKPTPPKNDYESFYVLARHRMDADTRTVAELLSAVRPGVLIDRNLLAEAATEAGVGSFAAAMDALERERQLEVDQSRVGFAHSVVHRSWLHTIAKPRARELSSAWLKVLAATGTSDDEALQMIPMVAPFLLEQRSYEQQLRLAQTLLGAGQSREALYVLESPFKLADRTAEPNEEMLQHALLAAQVHLNLGRYREVEVPLEFASAAASDPSDHLQVSLVRMKLALRRNEYGLLAKLSETLRSQTAHDRRGSLETELITNTAARDLLHMEELRASIERLRAIGAEGPIEASKIHRALSRSLAKLGALDEALTIAKQGLASADESQSMRDKGNAYLALAEVHRYRGEHHQAQEAYDQAIDIARFIGNRDSLLWSLLGKAASHITAEEAAGARAVLAEVTALTEEPGFEHPLESAHLGLLSFLADMAGKQRLDEALARYARLGVEWPVRFVEAVSDSEVGQPIPL